MATEAAAMSLHDLLTVKDETDVDGRLLLEDSAPKKARRRVHKAGVAMHSVTCTYADTPSRVGGLMNQSAYDALRHDTAEILNGFAWLTTNYLRRTPTMRRTVRLLFEVSHLGITLPLLLLHRADEPFRPHGHIPSPIASIFKASRGVSSAAMDLLNKRGPATRKLTTAEVVAFADQEGHLRRDATDRACAAPTRLIERTLEVLLSGEGADPDASILNQHLDFARLWAFYAVNDSFSEAVSRYSFVLGRLMEANATPDPTQLFGQPIPLPGMPPTFGDLTAGMLTHANTVQARLNELLGRRTDGPTIDFDALMAML